MKTFISYSRTDRGPVSALRSELEEIGAMVWMDSRLSGGQQWWSSILGEIRECELFILAVSRASLGSEACISETNYAVGIHRPVLPVIVDTQVTSAMLPPELKQFQTISFDSTTTESIRSLARALLTRQTPPALPDPLPDPPALPSSYGDDYRRRLIARTMTVDDQIQLSALLKVHCADPTHGEEAHTLLAELRARSDIALIVAQDIDRFLLPPPTSAPAPRPKPNPRLAPAETTKLEDTTGEFEEWLIEQLRAIDCSDLYLDPEIPPQKLANARATTSIASDDRVLALINCNVFGSSKSCLLFTAREVVQHHAQHRLKNFRLLYSELEANYSAKSYSVIDSNGVQVFAFGGAVGGTDRQVAKLLNDIHAHLSSRS